MAKIINGKKIADKIRKNLKKKIASSKIQPGLAAILVGNNPASEIYVELKEKASAEMGIYFEKYLFPEKTKEITIVEKIKELNKNKKIHGILVQLPLPFHLDEQKVIETISPEKDADGFHPVNLKKFYKDRSLIISPLLQTIKTFLEQTGETLNGKRGIVLGNSELFVKNVEIVLERLGIKSQHFHDLVYKSVASLKQADIVIIALGKPHFIQPQQVKKGVIVIDVGFNRIKGKVLGDVHPSVREKASFFTPVPGGVGPMTVAMLLENVFQLAKKQK